MSPLDRILSTPLKSKGRNVMTLTGGYAVAAVNSHMNDVEAYAALFAASVEMLESLKFAVARVKLSSNPILSEWLPDAEKIIAKAEGQVIRADGKTPPTSFAYSPWRHGGWYVNNVRYPSGACGCVSRNYTDKKWRIACDPRPFEEQPTFKSRDEAALAEWYLANGEGQ